MQTTQPDAHACVARRTFAAVFLLLSATCAFATDSLQPLRAQFALPNERIDYTEAKLVVDKLIDPGTDVAALRKALGQWEAAVRTNVPSGATTRQTFDALVKTLYEPGPWNQHKPFAYDLDDPLGTKPETKRLTTYLATRKGNCISMPILVVILGQRLGLPVALTIAPDHVLVKFFDDTQQAWLNFEATAGGFKTNASIEHELGITAKAIENELYLRPLTPREGVGLMASTLMEHYGKAGNAEALMTLADLALAVNPRDLFAILAKGNAYFVMTQRFVDRYPRVSDIPREQVADWWHASRENLAWFAKAEALGWEEPTPEQRAEYLKSIEREKARRKR